MTLFGLMILLAACSSGDQVADLAAPPDNDRSVTPVIPSLVPEPSPTPFVVPTTVQLFATPTPTEVGAETTAETTADPTPTAAAITTATPRPIPTVAPTSAPTSAPAPTAIVVRPTPRPAMPTATPVRATSTPVPAPTSGWVNPDCYVGPGAADEPVWWCGGRICWVDAPHNGCPTTPPVAQAIEVGCTISDRFIVVDELITLRAFQNPANVPIAYAFEHGDGTVDRTNESLAYYQAPGSYDVVMRWNYGAQYGRVFCGTVSVSGIAQPSPTPTPGTPVQIGCTVSDRDIAVNEVITLQATANVADLPISFVFDHGDGTLDATARSQALYLAPGNYNVRLRWAHSGTNGVVSCGTVNVS